MKKVASIFDRLFFRFLFVNGIYVLISSMFNLQSTDRISLEYLVQLGIAMIWVAISSETKENK